MPGQRAPGQKLIPVPVDVDFLAEIDAAIKKSSYGNRAEFIRDAIVEKLKREGYDVTVALSKAPSRLGKGGRYPEHRPDNYVLNEKPNSKTGVAGAKLLKKGGASVGKHDAK